MLSIHCALGIFYTIDSGTNYPYISAFMCHIILYNNNLTFRLFLGRKENYIHIILKQIRLYLSFPIKHVFIHLSILSYEKVCWNMNVCENENKFNYLSFISFQKIVLSMNADKDWIIGSLEHLWLDYKIEQVEIATHFQIPTLLLKHNL